VLIAATLATGLMAGVSAARTGLSKWPHERRRTDVGRLSCGEEHERWRRDVSVHVAGV
jgi:hypothetical protein